MPKSIKSRAVPAMLKWCREKSGLTVDAVAKLERITPATLNEWESGHGTPSLARLRSLARRYKRPMMVFYLPAPPREFSIVKDLRTLRSGRQPTYSPRLRLSIRIAQERQAWAASYLEETGAAPVKLIGTVNRSKGVKTAAETLAQAIAMSSGGIEGTSSDSKAFSFLRNKFEFAGVFVFQARGVPIEEMRGFALPNRFAPAVVVNAADSPSAKIFTLMHELVHLGLGESALTGSGVFGSEATLDSPGTEKFCNRVAAEILVPAVDIRSRVASADPGNRQFLSTLSQVYHVSRAVLAMRLVELGIVDDKYLKSVMPMLMVAPKKKKRDIEIPGFRLAIGRNGEYFSRLAITAFRNGDIHGGELAGLLSMKLNHLPKLERQVFHQTMI